MKGQKTTKVCKTIPFVFLAMFFPNKKYIGVHSLTCSLVKLVVYWHG